MLNLAGARRWLAALALIAGAVPALAQTAPSPSADTPVAVATFAGGCFWCVEEAFEKVPGVIRAVSGYTGGTVDRPTYEDVSSKLTGHYEAVQVTFDPTKVSYAQLVDWFWHNIDPVDSNGQFCDKGGPYHTAIFTPSFMAATAPAMHGLLTQATIYRACRIAKHTSPSDGDGSAPTPFISAASAGV